MLPQVRPEGVRLREYGWAAVVFGALIAAWLTLPFMSGTGSDSASIEDALARSEQSLHSIEDGRGRRRPGRELPEAGASLYQAPGEPVSGGNIPENLASALRQVSRSAVPVGGPPGAAGKPKAGAPLAKASFPPPGQSAAAASGSAASAAVAPPFGLGGNPGLDEGTLPADSSAGTRRGMPGSGPRLSAGGGQAFSSLRQESESMRQTLLAPDEAAASVAKRNFDVAGVRARGLVSGMPLEGPGLVEGETPANLKANDPNMNFKELIPPEIGKASETKDKDNKQYMEQQLMMMLLSIAVGGILGPFFGAMGQAMARAFGFNAPTTDNMNRVRPSAPNTVKV